MSRGEMMSCRRAVEELWAYIDGELPPDQARLVYEHLAACNQCYPHFDFQKAFCEFLKRQQCLQAPAGLRRRIFLTLITEESAGGTTP